jgi:hypothetical protein
MVVLLRVYLFAFSSVLAFMGIAIACRFASESIIIIIIDRFLRS